MIRGSVLSDARVIERLNRDFVPCMLDVTADGIPSNVPALSPWVEACRTVPWFRLSFGHTVVISPDGEHLLGVSGLTYDAASEIVLDLQGTQFMKHLDPDWFLGYLGGCRERLERLRAGEDPGDALAGLVRPPPEERREYEAHIRGCVLVCEGVDNVAAEVVRGFGNPDPRARRVALKGLGRLGPSAAVYASEVTRLLDDPDPSVREMAAWTLDRLLGCSGSDPAGGP